MLFTVEAGLLLLTAIILLGPLIAERFRVPGLVGLIFLGMVCGPYVLGWLQTGGLVATVGAFGLLYLMFLAGVELDLKSFAENRRAAITFGLMTFIIPFGLSYLVGSFVLEYSLAASALVGAMWASHTLVAYPEAKAAHLESNRAVASAVSATVITDVLALVILGFAASSAGDPGSGGIPRASTEASPLPVWIGIVVLAVFTLWVLPRVTRWFFTRVGHTRTQRFTFVLAGLAAGAFVSLIGGIEGLVGAFLAGIGMNRQIPAKGELMERIEFVGAALFVPAFLVSVGLSLDPAAMVQLSTIRLALLFTAIVLVGKTLAAVICGARFRFSSAETGIMAALTIGQAAATLAIAQVGVATGIFDQEILNAAVLTVVLTVFVTSIGTRYFARGVDRASLGTEHLGSRVLTSTPDEETRAGIVAVGLAVARPDDGLLLPFVVTGDGADEPETASLQAAVDEAVRQGHDCEGILRVADSFSAGALSLARERRASLIVLPWDGPRFPGDFVFGNGIDEIGEASSTPVAAAHVLAPTWDRVVVFTGQITGLPAEHDDLVLAVELARRVATAHRIPMAVFSTDESLHLGLDPDEVTLTRYTAGDTGVLENLGSGDLVVVPAHVVAGSRLFGLRRLAATFARIPLVVVGGPGRLVLTRRYRQGRVHGAVGSTRGEPAGAADR